MVVQLWACFETLGEKLDEFPAFLFLPAGFCQAWEWWSIRTLVKTARTGLEYMLLSAVACCAASSERRQNRDGDDIHVAVINTVGKSNSRTLILTWVHSSNKCKAKGWRSRKPRDRISATHRKQTEKGRRKWDEPLNAHSLGCTSSREAPLPKVRFCNPKLYL